jgi:hypothetical protein
MPNPPPAPDGGQPTFLKVSSNFQFYHFGFTFVAGRRG